MHLDLLIFILGLGGLWSLNMIVEKVFKSVHLYNPLFVCFLLYGCEASQNLSCFSFIVCIFCS